MQQEEAILFRLAEEMLDDEIKISLIIAFAGKEAEAQGITQQYEQLAKELEKGLGCVNSSVFVGDTRRSWLN